MNSFYGNEETCMQRLVLNEGVQVDRFELEKFLGEGGMGEVWLAVDPNRKDHKHSGFVVLKFLKQEIRANSQAVEEFEIGYRRVQQLNHTNIVPLYDIGRDEHFGVFQVMQFVEGTTLQDLISERQKRGKTFSLDEICDLLGPVADALDYSAEANIVHCDVKPANIIVEKSTGRPYVLDFGLATEIRATLSRHSRTRVEIPGTALYMSPEQWKAQPLNKFTDQYSLAVVAWELLFGRQPFVGDDRQMYNAVTREPVPDFPFLLDIERSVFEKSLDKNPAKRFESCCEFLLSLKRAKKPAVSPLGVSEFVTSKQYSKPIADQYSTARMKIRGFCDELAEITELAGMYAIKSKIQNLVKKIQSDAVVVAIAGEFSTGKSSLINAFMGTELLPTSAKVCTSLPTRIRTTKNGKPVQFLAVRIDGTKSEMSIKEFTQTVGPKAFDGGASGVTEVEIHVPVGEGLANVELVDTPGVNDAGLRGEQITLDYLPRADAVVFITRVDQLLKASEMRFLQERIASLDLQKTILVLNAVDLAEGEDIPFIEKRVEDLVGNIIPGNRRLLFSAKNALKAIKSEDEKSIYKSGLSQLRQLISDCGWQNGIGERVSHWKSLLMRFSDDIKSNVNFEKGRALDDDNLKQFRIDKIGRALSAIESDQEGLLSFNSTIVSELKRNSLDFALRHVAENRNQGSTNRTVKDLQRQVGSAVSKLQDYLRQSMPMLKSKLAEKISILFGEIDQIFVDGDQDSVEVSMNLFNWDVLVDNSVSATQTELSTNSNVKSVLGSGIFAGVGATLGAIALGPISAVGGAIGLGAAAFMAAKYRQKALASSKACEPAVASLKLNSANVEQEIRNALDVALQGVEHGLAADIKRMVNVKKEELLTRLEQLKSDVRTSNSLSVDACEELFKKLEKFESNLEQWMI